MTAVYPTLEIHCRKIPNRHNKKQLLLHKTSQTDTQSPTTKEVDKTAKHRNQHKKAFLTLSHIVSHMNWCRSRCSFPTFFINLSCVQYFIPLFFILLVRVFHVEKKRNASRHALKLSEQILKIVHLGECLNSRRDSHSLFALKIQFIYALTIIFVILTSLMVIFEVAIRVGQKFMAYYITNKNR